LLYRPRHHYWTSIPGVCICDHRNGRIEVRYHFCLSSHVGLGCDSKICLTESWCRCTCSSLQQLAWELGGRRGTGHVKRIKSNLKRYPGRKAIVDSRTWQDLVRLFKKPPKFRCSTNYVLNSIRDCFVGRHSCDWWIEELMAYFKVFRRLLSTIGNLLRNRFLWHQDPLFKLCRLAYSEACAGKEPLEKGKLAERPLAVNMKLHYSTPRPDDFCSNQYSRFHAMHLSRTQIIHYTKSP